MKSKQEIRNELDLIQVEMEYIAQQNKPYTAIGGGLRYLCALHQVKYANSETDAIIRKRLLKKLELQADIEAK